MKRITPLNGHLTIQPDELEKATAAGILLVESLGSYSPTGVIIDIDPTITTLKAGDHVVYSEYGVTEFDKDLVIASVAHIYGIIHDDPAA